MRATQATRAHLLPIQVASELPESALYCAAEDLERSLDARLLQEKQRVALMALGRERPAKKLRLFLQSRHFHQAAAAAAPGQPAAGARRLWRLR